MPLTLKNTGALRALLFPLFCLTLLPFISACPGFNAENKQEKVLPQDVSTTPIPSAGGDDRGLDGSSDGGPDDGGSGGDEEDAGLELQSVEPNFGPVSGGKEVTLKGSSFKERAKIYFGTSECISPSVAQDGKSATCTTPTHIHGLVKVALVNPGGKETSLDNGYTYQTPALLTISDGPGIFRFADTIIGIAQRKIFTLGNEGESVATSIRVADLLAPYLLVGGTCGVSLAPQSACTLIVSFLPLAADTFPGILSLKYNDSVFEDQPATRQISGNGLGGATLSIVGMSSFDFGLVVAGSTQEKSFTLKNTGLSTAMNIHTASPLAVPISWAGGYPGRGGTCGTSLPPGATCILVTTFAPTEAANAYSTTLAIDYGNGVEAADALHFNFDLAGAAKLPAALTLSDVSNGSFGVKAKGGVYDLSVSLTNAGQSGAIISGVRFNPVSGPYSFKGGTFPGGGTCGAALNTGDTCTFTVSFSPTQVTVDPITTEVNVEYDDGVGSQIAVHTLSGRADEGAFIAVDAASYNFGAVLKNTTAEKTFSLTNNGARAAADIQLPSLSGPFSYGAGGNCTGPLEPGASCSVTVVFAPTSLGLNDGSMRWSYNNGFDTQDGSMPITGTGVELAKLSFTSAPEFVIKSVSVGQTVPQTLTLINEGGVQATGLSGDTSVFDPSMAFPGGSFPGGGTCGATLDGGGKTCTVIVNFTPPDTNTRTGSLNVAYNDGSAAQTASLSLRGAGKGVGVQLVLTPDTEYAFKDKQVGLTDTKRIEVFNNGSAPATLIGEEIPLSAPFGYVGGSYPGTTDPSAKGCPVDGTLDPNDNCYLYLQFSPTLAGDFSGRLRLKYGENALGKVSLSLSGKGIGIAKLTLDQGPTLDFGGYPISTIGSRMIKLTNTGSTDATGIQLGAFTALTADGQVAPSGTATPFQFTSSREFPGENGTCFDVLAPGQWCYLDISFSPTAFLDGVRLADFSISYMNGVDLVNAKSVTRRLKGTGLELTSLTISDGPIKDYGARPVNSVTSWDFTITNNTSSDASRMVADQLAAPYRYKGGSYASAGDCGTELPAHTSCHFEVEFAPSVERAIPPYEALIQISFFDGANTSVAQRRISGTSIKGAVLELSDFPLYDFQTRAFTSGTDHIFTLKNSGGFAASDVGIAPPLSAPFSILSFPNSCKNLAVNATCEIKVRYSPTADPNDLARLVSASGALSLSYNDGGTIRRAVSTALIGTGAQPALLLVTKVADPADASPNPPLNFGTVIKGNSPARKIKVTNLGGVAAEISPSSLTSSLCTNPLCAQAPFFYSYRGDLGFPGSGGDCQGTIAANSDCYVFTQFSPDERRRYSGRVEYIYTDGAQPGQISGLDLIGDGVLPGHLTISVGDTAVSPTSDATFDFGAHPKDSFTYKNFKLKNDGGYTVTILPPSTIGSDFAYNDGTVERGETDEFPGSIQPMPGSGEPPCGSTLAAGASCRVVVRFKPSISDGSYASETIQISYTNGVLPSPTATRAIKGKGTGGAILQILASDTESLGENLPLIDFGYQVINAAVRKPLYLKNVGAYRATNIKAGLLDPTFAYDNATIANPLGGPSASVYPACTDILEPSATCEMRVVYNLSSTQSFLGTIRVALNNGVGPEVVARDVTSTGVNAAKVASVTISSTDTPDGIYRSGATMSIQVIFDREVNVVGTPKMKLNTLSAGFEVTTSPASNTKTLLFPYTVVAGHNASLLDVASAALVLPPGTTITDVLGGKAVDPILPIGTAATSLASNRRIAIDTSAELTIDTDPTSFPKFDFGTRAVGSTKDQVFKIHNGGEYAASSLSLAPSPEDQFISPSPYSIVGGLSGCSTIARGADCSITVKYTPILGQSPSALVLRYRFDGGTQTKDTRIALDGGGAPKAEIVMTEDPSTDADPFTLAYGDVVVGNSPIPTLKIHLENKGGVTAKSISPQAFPAGSPFAYASGSDCGSELLAGRTCTLFISFNPGNYQHYTGSVALQYDNGIIGNASALPISLDGQGLNPANLTIHSTLAATASSTPSDYDYGDHALGSNTFHSFLVINSGTTKARITQTPSFGADYVYNDGIMATNLFPGTETAITGPPSIAPCGSEIAPAASCVLVVRYSPLQATALPVSDQIRITYESGAGSVTATRSVQGRGTGPALLVLLANPTEAVVASPPVIDVGDQLANTDKPVSLTLKNIGGMQASLVQQGSPALAAPFLYANAGNTFPGSGAQSCGATLDKNTSCTIFLNFHPTSPGSSGDIVEAVRYDDGTGTKSVARTLKGNGLRQYKPILISSLNSNGTYKSGANVDITVQFDAAVTVVGAPEILLETGTTDQKATYRSGSGSDTLVFRYTVVSGDASSHLDINAAAPAITYPTGASIKDSVNVNSVATALYLGGDSRSLFSNRTIVVDTTLAPLSVSSGIANGSYTVKAGQVIPIQVAFDRNVTVTTPITLTLETGATDRTISYTSGSGSNTLVFNYTVQANDDAVKLDVLATGTDASGQPIGLIGGAGNIKAGVVTSLMTLPAGSNPGSLSLNKNIRIDTQAPPVPAAPIPPGVEVSTSSIAYTWNPVTDNDPSPVSYGIIVYDNNVAQTEAAVTGTSYTYTAGQDGHTYSASLRAKDAAGNYSNYGPINTTTTRVVFPQQLTVWMNMPVLYRGQGAIAKGRVTRPTTQGTRTINLTLHDSSSAVSIPDPTVHFIEGNKTSEEFTISVSNATDLQMKGIRFASIEASCSECYTGRINFQVAESRKYDFCYGVADHTYVYEQTLYSNTGAYGWTALPAAGGRVCNATTYYKAPAGVQNGSAQQVMIDTTTALSTFRQNAEANMMYDVIPRLFLNTAPSSSTVNQMSLFAQDAVTAFATVRLGSSVTYNPEGKEYAQHRSIEGDAQGVRVGYSKSSGVWSAPDFSISSQAANVALKTAPRTDASTLEIRLTFPEKVLPATINPTNVTVFNSSGQQLTWTQTPVAVDSDISGSASKFDIKVTTSATQSLPIMANYLVKLGTGIQRARNANAFDFNGDGTPGGSEDVLTLNLADAMRFDFNYSAITVNYLPEAGFTPISTTTAVYTTGSSYFGFSAMSITAPYSWSDDYLRRSSFYSSARTFYATVLPDKNYSVRFYLGGPTVATTTKIGVEGTNNNTLNPDLTFTYVNPYWKWIGPSLAVNQYATQVITGNSGSDGVLAILLEAGLGSYWQLSGLEIWDVDSPDPGLNYFH